MPGYYEDLSGESSDGCSSNGEESDDDSGDDRLEGRGEEYKSNRASLLLIQKDAVTPALHHHRIILHADVDCFYCQVEMLERKIERDRPLAVGQKHIIATCNYAAREAGVTKLMGRQAALIRCPHLLIVDGSDLERYRIHARKIYESFRKHCQRLHPESRVAKGHMDEMMADLSSSNSGKNNHNNNNRTQHVLSKDVFVYGRNTEHSTGVFLTEDQSGAQTFVKSNLPGVMPNMRSNDPDLEERLFAAAALALEVRQAIHDETGFNVTMGISVNPLLAKLASGLQKPGKVNILHPNDRSLVESMPLRKISGIGSRTMKALKPCLISTHGNKQASWTCRDLLQIPRREIIDCLQNINSNTLDKSTEQCDVLLKLCRGIDESIVVDDEGGAQKTLSIENSFKQGSLVTKEKLLTVMEDLYTRLPRLLNDRTAWSRDKKRAYPTTIRLSVRFVGSDRSIGANRTKSTTTVRSQQMPFDGKVLLSEQIDPQKQTVLIRRFVEPLLQSMVLSLHSFNISRINIALTNFQDLSLVSTGDKRTAAFTNAISPKKSATVASHVASLQSHTTKRSMSAGASRDKGARSVTSQFSSSSSQPIDASVLAELPPEIAAEVKMGLHSTRQSSPKKQRIDDFFARKEK